VEKIKNSVASPFVLQIGAMDGVYYDMLNPHLVAGGWRGILIEPLADMFAALQKTYAAQPDLTLLNCAVSDHEGSLTLRRINPQAVADGFLSKEALGMTTGFTDRGFPARDNYQELYAPHMIEVQLPCYPLQNILDAQKVEKIDVVVIDAEGADWLIARQINFARYKTRFLCIEYSSLKPDEVQHCYDLMRSMGYDMALCQEDLENMLFYKEAGI
jgi:FkbM family methyltransferase